MFLDDPALFRDGLPAPAPGRFAGFPAYNRVGGHNDADTVPSAELAAAAPAVLAREGHDLAMYNMRTGPQGYRPLREVTAALLARRAGIACTADDVLVTSGSLQALDLVFDLFVGRGDTVLVEQACYGGSLTRLRSLGADLAGIATDADGMVPEHLAEVLERLAGRGVRPRFLYTIPTVQNPTGTVLSLERRHRVLEIAGRFGLPVVEDDCYADLLWEGKRPTALRGLDTTGRVIYCGSFSKSIAPALRVGYVVADWPAMRRLLPLKRDGGTGAVEQMVLAEYAAERFDAHVEQLNAVLKAKCQTMMAALAEQFGAAAEFAAPKGGIFLWITLPDAVDTTRLFQVAGAEGVALNPGAEWVADPAQGRHRLRLCFAHPGHDEIREGVARLARICHREFGVPVHGANVAR